MFPPLELPDDWLWPGLHEDELIELELAWCAHRDFRSWRERFGGGTIPKPIDRCAYFIGRLCDLAWTHKPTPLVEKLAKLIKHESDGAISNFKKHGKTLWVSEEPENWEKCRKIVTGLLLGNTKHDPNNSRFQVATRIVEFFFEYDRGLPVFFMRTVHSDFWERPAEVYYQLLWFAHQQEQKTVIATSGQVPFAQVLEGELTRLGELSFVLAAKGGKLVFVYPDPEIVGSTPAHESVQSLFDIYVQFANSETYPTLIKQLVRGLDRPMLDDTFQNISRVQLAPSILVDVVEKSKEFTHLRRVWAGQCLNLSTKYIYYELLDRETPVYQEFYLTRAADLRPFIIREGPEQMNAFQAWRYTILGTTQKTETLADYYSKSTASANS